MSRWKENTHQWTNDDVIDIYLPLHDMVDLYGT